MIGSGEKREVLRTISKSQMNSLRHMLRGEGWLKMVLEEDEGNEEE